LNCPDPTQLNKQSNGTWTCNNPKQGCSLSTVDRLGEVCQLRCPQQSSDDAADHITVCTTEGWSPKLKHVGCQSNDEEIEITDEYSILYEDTFEESGKRTPLRGIDKYEVNGENKNSEMIDYDSDIFERYAEKEEESETATNRFKRCLNTASVKHGSWDCVGSEYESTCVLSCRSGYRPDGDGIINCVNGNWDEPPYSVQCKRSREVCQRPPGAEFGKWICEDDECELHCNPGYFSILPVVISCSNDVWCTKNPGISCRKNPEGIRDEMNEQVKESRYASENEHHILGFLHQNESENEDTDIFVTDGQMEFTTEFIQDNSEEFMQEDYMDLNLDDEGLVGFDSEDVFDHENSEFEAGDYVFESENSAINMEEEVVRENKNERRRRHRHSSRD